MSTATPQPHATHPSTTGGRHHSILSTPGGTHESGSVVATPARSTGTTPRTAPTPSPSATAALYANAPGAESAVFFAAVENVRLVAPLLRAVQIKDWVQLTITSRGLRATASDAAGTVQATAYVSREVFRAYRFTPPLPAAPLVKSEESMDVDPPTARVRLDADGNPRGSREMLSSPPPPEDPPEDPEYPLTVDMATLLDCLNIYNSATVPASAAGTPATSLETHAAAAVAGFGGSGTGTPATSLKIWSVDPAVTPLNLLLADASDAASASVQTRCALNPFLAPDNAHLELAEAWAASGPPVCAVILPAHVLRDALAELGIREPAHAAASSAASAAERAAAAAGTTMPDSTQPGATAKAAVGMTGVDREIHLSILPSASLSLATAGIAGTARVHIPRAACDRFTLNTPTNGGIEARYPGAALDACMRALGIARQCLVRVNGRGFLNVQCMVDVRKGASAGAVGGAAGGGVHCFVEVVVAPLERAGSSVTGW
ncbi:checkpoint clamp complex protein Rad1 [Blastocladiella emersonii ATCC 22665]|nr:checkpoint clamp complex protein Rad1 [Blastocladiella emersonii ATCC 22665]